MITFRKVKENDLEIVRDIAFKTWPSTYNDIVGEDQVAYMLEKMYNKGALLDQLENGCVFLIAEREQHEVGFTAFDNIDPENGVYKLHKLYLLPEEHGTGIGKIMMNEVYNQVRRAGGSCLQLNVNKKNKALQFYERMGFKIKKAVTIDIGNGFVMDDYIMELPLK
ncbi:MAG: GNAT family N-acetyltransferase [Chitinophagaceae bacterium]|nr:MAG: GNAT family N-acetyltransferase [Chitinophagaceae bacterium]